MLSCDLNMKKKTPPSPPPLFPVPTYVCLGADPPVVQDLIRAGLGVVAMAAVGRVIEEEGVAQPGAGATRLTDEGGAAGAAGVQRVRVGGRAKGRLWGGGRSRGWGERQFCYPTNNLTDPN